MTAQRYRQDALYELAAIEGAIRSKRKTLEHTAKASTARTTEATLPSLERQAVALRAEAAALPDRPTRAFAYATASGDDWKRPCPVAPDDPIFATLEIPEFLKRACPPG